MSKKKKGLGKFLAGIVLGTGLGVLFAPKKGSETREQLKIKIEELLEKVKKMDKDEVKENIENKIEEIKIGLDDLDKEKVLKIARDKAKKIQDMADELVQYVIDKGTPVMEKTASAVKEKAIVVTREILEKLEREA